MTAADARAEALDLLDHAAALSGLDQAAYAVARAQVYATLAVSLETAEWNTRWADERDAEL